MIRYALCMLLSMSLSGFAYSGQEDIASLKAACEAAREQKLAPEREALIEECIEKGKDKDYCHRYYKDYGAGGRTAAGGARLPKYFDLPECQALDRAERNIK